MVAKLNKNDRALLAELAKYRLLTVSQIAGLCPPDRRADHRRRLPRSPPRRAGHGSRHGPQPQLQAGAGRPHSPDPPACSRLAAERRRPGAGQAGRDQHAPRPGGGTRPRRSPSSSSPRTGCCRTCTASSATNARVSGGTSRGFGKHCPTQPSGTSPPTASWTCSKVCREVTCELSRPGALPGPAARARQAD